MVDAKRCRQASSRSACYSCFNSTNIIFLEEFIRISPSHGLGENFSLFKKFKYGFVSDSLDYFSE